MKEFLTEQEFNTGISEGIVVVDIFAVWCGPCQVLAPILEEIAEEMNSISFGKADCDKIPTIAEKFLINTVPTVLIFKNGEKVEQFAGVMPKTEIISVIQKHI